MTLRLRLVAALVVLLTSGLALFGLVTYKLYSDAEFHQLDSQLRSALDPVSDQLVTLNQLGTGPGGARTNPNGNIGHGPLPPDTLEQATFAELRNGAGQVVGSPIQLSQSAEVPKLATVLNAPPGGQRLFDTRSISGSAHWRVIVSPVQGHPDYSVVIAAPTTDVTSSLHRLEVIEASAAIALLTALAFGSWLILRRGLLPLEHMARSARSITAGDLSQRVSPSNSHSEVGQLGLALNTMLGDIEGAFQERAQTEQRLRQFLSDASHELRTPLTSIQGFAELFRLDGEQGKIELPIIMRRIEDESIRMKHLVEDLLLLARLDETRPVDRQPVDLAVLAADACTDAVATAPDRKVTLDAPDPVIVLGDEDHLRQAVANLVTNAVRHTPDGSAITVSAAVDGGAATVAVRDHGPGLAPDALAHVFDRFWQADDARVGTGAGLGLSIVAAIAAEHGGAVAAANVDGGGARFSLTLPLHAS